MMHTVHAVQPATAGRRTTSRLAATCLVGIMMLSALLYFTGLRQELPYTPNVDEPVFMVAALRVASGNLHPGWFGHPGSTIIYPLGGLYALWDAVTGYTQPVHGTSLFERFLMNPEPAYMLGRLISVSYALGCIPLAFTIGRRIYGQFAGLLAALFTALSPLALAHAQMLRTDSAGAFFLLLALLALLHALDAPTHRRIALVGAVVGLAIASRYFMVVLLPIFVLALIIDGLSHRRSFGVLGSQVIIFGSAAIAAFALSTPYAFIDYRATIQSLSHEAITTVPGADGFSPLGNLWYYLTTTIPDDQGWLRLGCAVIGVWLAVRQRHAAALVIIGVTGLFLAAISLSALHWDRWVIPVLPLLALLGAGTLAQGAHWLRQHLRHRPAIITAGVTLCALLALLWPAGSVLAAHTATANRPTTRVLARQWVQSHVPNGAQIAQEKYAVPLAKEDMLGYISRGHERALRPVLENRLLLAERFSLAAGHTLNDYRAAGYTHLIISSWIADRFLSQPQRYPQEAAFYRALATEATLVAEFTPNQHTAGPTISVYALAAP